MKTTLISITLVFGALATADANKSYSRILNPRVHGKSKIVHKGYIGKPKVETKADGTVIIRKRKAGPRRVFTGPTSRRSVKRLFRRKSKD